MNEKEPSKEQQEKWIQDPSNWKLGLFYYKPADKRIFPPKRIKAFGWTINFANPTSVLAMVAIIAFVYAIAVLILGIV